MNPSSNETSRLAAAQRQRRYSARKREQRGLLSRNAFPIRLKSVRQLQSDILRLPKTTLLIPIIQAREIIEMIRRLVIRQDRLTHRVAVLTQQLCWLRHQRRLTDRVIQCRDLNKIAEWWLNRRGASGKDLHASALGKHGSVKRRLIDPSAMVKAGRKGAEVRWARARAAQSAQPVSES